MRWSPLLAISALALSGPAGSSLPTAKAAPVTSATPSLLACPDLDHLADQRPRPTARIHKLTELPPAQASYAMLRTRNGCPDLTPVRMRR